jgi:hypothetical protein
MNEINDLSGEFTDDFLHAQADAGDCLREEEGFQQSANPGRDEEACARRVIATLYRSLERQITMG